MKFNSLIPELSVSDIDVSKRFYMDILGFRLEYERTDDQFAFLSFEGSQLMLEQINGYWRTGELKKPFGRGVNFQIGTRSIAAVLDRLHANNIPLFREPTQNSYACNGTNLVLKEFLVQDPDGYLLRFSQSDSF